MKQITETPERQLAECATHPSTAFPKSDEEPVDNTSLYLALGATVCATAAFVFIWRKNSTVA